MKPLEGITVLDFTQFTAGPVVTMLLADMGATVLRMENPPYGDSNYYNTPSLNKHSCIVSSLDHNKYSVLMNGKDEAMRSILYKMVESADIVVDNSKAGTTKKLGIDFDTLKEINPAIVCCSVSGFGQDGPWAKRAAYDTIIQAVGGMMAVTGEKGGRAIKAGFSLADVATGASTVSAILSGVYQAKTTGKGCFIDCSMMEGAANMLMDQVAHFDETGKDPDRLGNESAYHVPYNTYDCKDKKVMLCVRSDEEFKQFCTALNAESLAEAYPTEKSRLAARDEINAAVAALLATMDSATVCEKMEKAAVCCAPVHTLPEASESAQMTERHMNNTFCRFSDGTEMPIVGCPVKISGMPDDEVRRGPCISEDTLDVVSRYVGEEKAHAVYDSILAEAAPAIAERSSKMK